MKRFGIGQQNLLKKLGFLDIAPIKALQYGYEI